MATKRKQTKKRSNTGGTLSGMRSGMKRVAGTGGKKRKKKKQQTTFFQVFAWVLGIALLLVLVWGMSR